MSLRLSRSFSVSHNYLSYSDSVFREKEHKKCQCIRLNGHILPILLCEQSIRDDLKRKKKEIRSVLTFSFLFSVPLERLLRFEAVKSS